MADAGSHAGTSPTPPMGADAMHVEFHCHSSCSDGILGPAALADRLAAAGVAFAALTDHDTVEGLAAFRTRLERRGVMAIAGVEITTRCNGAEAHLLAYGFNPADTTLLAMLRAIRRTRAPEVQGIAHSVAALPEAAEGTDVPEGIPDIDKAIAVVHRAGGKAFLAHPAKFEPDLARLRALLGSLKSQGLDGIEALYGPMPADQQARLADVAAATGLLVCAGSDVHAFNEDFPYKFMAMPTEAWRLFRAAVCATAPPAATRTIPVRSLHHHVFLHIVAPTVLAIGLFMAAIYTLFLPSLERMLLDRKREMIRELINSAWSILAECEGDERAGVLTHQQAQDMAKARIKHLRYGREGKDYFWLQDLQPRMLMHPYRADLDGTDVAEFKDPRGVRIFVEFATLAKREKEGYVDYVWQWKDDPRRLEQKESYIRLFEPWGWIVGTGIYIEDVNREIAKIERHLVHTSIGISLLVSLLLLYVMRQSLRIEKARCDAEAGLRESTERYRSLVEATTEGALFVLENRCQYANPTLRDLLGYAEWELSFLTINDIMPAGSENVAAWDAVARVLRSEEPIGGFEAILRNRTGAPVECVATVSRIEVGEKKGFILLAKRIGIQSVESSDGSARAHATQLGRSADGVPVGIVRARAARGGTIIEANRAACQILASLRHDSNAPPADLAALFPDPAAFVEFLDAAARDNTVERTLYLARTDGNVTIARLCATVAKDDRGKPQFLDCALDDVTRRGKHDAEREALVEKLQTSLLFLHQPVANATRGVVACTLDTPIRAAAALMNAHDSSTLLVRDGTGISIGIVTDLDLRSRVVGAGLDPQTPVHRVMSSPLVTIVEHAHVYEALMAMEEHHVQHLAVVNDAGDVVGVAMAKDLLQFHTYGANVLPGEIARAATPGDVAQLCRRMPTMVASLLECGAHPRNITRMVSSMCDAATERFVAVAIKELGQPPAPFAFMALGSQGRREQTLHTDQDNALVFMPPKDARSSTDPAAYFLELGTRVCGWLDQAGYALCRGGVLARTPRWCQPLDVWKKHFDGWIQSGEPQQLVEFSIFFDFRAVGGGAEVAHALRRHVHDALHAEPEFFPHAARSALEFKPPSRLFGKIGAGQGVLNLKDALMPIVAFARLYALHHAIDETHTLARLDALAAQGHLLESTRTEIAAAYEFLMRLRLRHQVATAQAGGAADNMVDCRTLGHADNALLSQAFAQIAAVQQKIAFDFLGGHAEM